jgi:outer membrane receptor protein involved in Fe transport
MTRIEQRARLRSILKLTTGFLVLAAGSGALADETTVAQNGSPGVETVIVTAEKKEERLQDTPVPVSVIAPENLTDNGQSLFRDYFTQVPGLIYSPLNFSTANLTIRGITTGGFINPTVGVLVDDVPFGGNLLTDGGQRLPEIDPGDLSRIEELRGPQGTLYGASSMGGLIKFVTVDPSTQGYSGRISAGISGVYNGAEPGFNIRGAVNIPVTDDFAVRVSAFRRQDPGYIDNVVSGVKGVNEAEVEGGRIAALWSPDANFSIKVTALYQKTHGSGFSEVDKRPGLGGLQQNYLPGAGEFDRPIENFTAAIKYNLGDIAFTALSGFYATRLDDSTDYSFLLGSLTRDGVPGLVAGFGDTGTPYVEHLWSHRVTQEVRVSMPIWKDFELLAGVFYSHTHSNESDSFVAANSMTGQFLGTEAAFGNPHIADTEMAVFANLTYRFSDRLDVQIGGRETESRIHSSGATDTGPFVVIFDPGPSPYTYPGEAAKANAFTYLATPRFQISPDWMAYARFSSGFRPGVLEGPKYPVVTPDQTKDYEAGFKGDFLDHRLSLDASLYYIDWTNIEIQLKDSQGFIYQANGSDATSKGIELSVNARPTDNLSVSAWVSYDAAALSQNFPANSAAYGVKGNQLPDTPRLSAHVSLEHEFPLPMWQGATGFVGVEASYLGHRSGLFQDTPVRQQYPAYGKVDLRAGVNYGSWSANVYINNVGDVRGVLNGGLGYSPPYAFVYIEPRLIGFNVARTF